MIQYSRFSNGGYVLHKITGYWRGHCSAWFDAGGKLLDAEILYPDRYASRPVKVGGPMWREVQRVGRSYLGRGAI